ncbi:MAG: type II toxin-antitoxin system prevent-host-death family antitoxin [Gammaproteobacteria bacterium]|nr:type II toxin-antitoxin system prevent-host-death family antitoxin [Gammaproteobacteria bacterium]
MKTASIDHAKNHLSRLVKEAQSGETIVIVNGNTPLAKLTAVEPHSNQRPKVGTRTSPPVRYQPDAFAPLKEGELKEWGL